LIPDFRAICAEMFVKLELQASQPETGFEIQTARRWTSLPVNVAGGWKEETW
jgi:hypothetical protein